MLTVVLTDFEVDGLQRGPQMLSASLVQNSGLVSSQSLGKLPIPLASLPIHPVANEFTVVLRDAHEIIGSVTIPARLFTNVSAMSVSRWLTLFDPLDDRYDGDLREDDFEAPRIKLQFQIKPPNAMPRPTANKNESKVQLPREKDENLSFVSHNASLDETANPLKELQMLRHKVQMLTENKDRVSVYKEKYKTLFQDFETHKVEWQDERGQLTIAVQQLQLEVTDLLKRLEEGDEMIAKMKEQYSSKIDYLQQESENAQDALQISFSKRDDEIQSYKNSLAELREERTSLYFQLDSEKQRWQNIMSDYTAVKEKYRQSLQDLQSVQRVQHVLQQKYEAELQQANSQLQTLSRQLVQMESQLNHTRLELKNAKDEGQSLKDRCTTLEALKAQMSLESQWESPPKLNLQGQGMWESTINQMNQQLEMLNKQLNNERASQGELRQQINQLSNQLNESENQRRNLQQELLRESESHQYDLNEQSSPNKEQTQQMNLLNQEKEILLSKIKVLEGAVQSKTEQHLEAQQEIQECKLKLQATLQRLQVQERLIEQIEQLRQDKLEQTEQLSTLQNQIYKLGEEILSESHDQEFSKAILVKINRIIQGKSAEPETKPESQKLVRQTSLNVVGHQAQKPKDSSPVKRTNTQRVTRSAKQPSQQTNSSRMTNILEEQHGDSFSIPNPLPPQPAKQTAPPADQQQFKSATVSATGSPARAFSSNSPSPSPERPRQTRSPMSAKPAATHASVPIQKKVIRSPSKTTVTSPSKQSPPKSVTTRTQSKESPPKAAAKPKDSPPRSGEKRRQSTLMNATKASTIKSTQKK